MVLLLAIGLALAGDGAPPKLISSVKIGASRSQVEKTLASIGATEIESVGFREPGAFADGLMASPSMMALLNRAGAKAPYFKALPKGGPEFVTARVGNARAAYGFLRGKLWSMAAVLPQRVVAPRDDPFDPDRMKPMRSTISKVCGGLKAVAHDEYRNAVAWRSSSCSSGKAMVWYDARDRDAAVQVVVYGR
jgi:hypothetical protein